MCLLYNLYLSLYAFCSAKKNPRTKPRIFKSSKLLGYTTLYSPAVTVAFAPLPVRTGCIAANKSAAEGDPSTPTCIIVAEMLLIKTGVHHVDNA